MAKKTRVELNQMSTGYQQLSLASIVKEGLRRSTVVSTGTQSQQEKATIKLKPQPLSDIEATALKNTPLGPQNWVGEARSGGPGKVSTRQWVAAWATHLKSVEPVVPHADRPSVISGSQPAKFSKKPPPLSRAGKQIVKKQAATAKASSLVENEFLARMSHRYHESRKTMLEAGMQAGKWKDWEEFASDKGRKQRYRAGAREELTNLVRDPELQKELSEKWNLPKEQVSQIGRDTLIGISENRYAERLDPKTGEVQPIKDIPNTAGDPRSRIPVSYHKGLHWSEEAMTVSPISTHPEMTTISERGALDLTDLEHKELTKNVKRGMVVSGHVDLPSDDIPPFERMLQVSEGTDIEVIDDSIWDYDADREEGLRLKHDTKESQVGVHSASDQALGNKQAEPQGRLRVVAPGQPNFDEAAYTALVESDYQKNVASGRVRQMGRQLRASKKRQGVEKQWLGSTSDKNVDLAIRQHLESQLSEKLSQGSSLLTQLKGKHKLESSWVNVAEGGAQGIQTSDDLAYLREQAASSPEDTGAAAAYEQDKPDPKEQAGGASVLENKPSDLWSKSDAPPEGANLDDYRKVKGQWFERQSPYTRRVKYEAKLESYMEQWRNMPEGKEKDILGQQLQTTLKQDQYRTAKTESSGLTLTDEAPQTRQESPHGQVAGQYYESVIEKDKVSGVETVVMRRITADTSDPNILMNDRGAASAGAIARAAFEATEDIDPETGRLWTKETHRLKALTDKQKLKVDLELAGVKHDPRFKTSSGSLLTLETPNPSGGEIGNPSDQGWDAKQDAAAKSSLISSGDRVAPGQVGAQRHPSELLGMSQEAYERERPAAYLSSDQASSSQGTTRPELKTSRYRLQAGAYVVKTKGGPPVAVTEAMTVTGRKVQVVDPTGKKVIAYDISGGVSAEGQALANESLLTQKKAEAAVAQQFRSTHGITSNAESLTPEQLSEVRANKNIKRVIGTKLVREGNSPNQVGEKIQSHLSTSREQRRSDRAVLQLKRLQTDRVGRKIGKALGKVPTVTAGAMPYLSLLSLAGPAVRVKEANVADFKEQQSRAIPPQLRPSDHPFPKPKMKSFTMSDYMTQYAHETFDMGTGEFPSLMMKRKQAKANPYSI